MVQLPATAAIEYVAACQYKHKLTIKSRVLKECVFKVHVAKKHKIVR